MTQQFVDAINHQQSSWTASTNQGPFFGDGFTYKDAKQLCGVTSFDKTRFPQREATQDKPIEALPTNFDSSVNWPNCPTIMTIRDQSACGSCWAFGGAEAMSDRYCTYLGNTDPKYQNVPISAGDLMSCCEFCGSGCGGGDPGAAWEYWVLIGIPTNICDPYPFPKCEHHITGGQYPPCPANEYPTPACNRTCADGSPKVHYHGSKSFLVTGEAALMNEIYNHGPVEVAFTVYQDFLTYKSGVYKHTSGSALGGHAVKMIGWGVTSTGEKYWIINNSWNADWGNKGQFWILRGVDECGIESSGVAGAPKQF